MIKVERAEAPLANFYQERAPWVKDSRCLGVKTNVFFDDIDCARGSAKEEALDFARSVCEACPVRVQCAERTMTEEGGSNEDDRYGFRAYMTPAQRASVHRRGGLKGQDPKRIVEGWDGDRKVPPIPYDGDNWSKHTTTLARRTVRWIVDHIEIGENLPPLSALCRSLSAHETPMKRVLTALVQDGTLDAVAGPKLGRKRVPGPVTYVRRQTPESIAHYLPPHLKP